MNRPKKCSHKHATKIREQLIVFGNPGFLPAVYQCDDCGVRWDDAYMSSVEREKLHQSFWSKTDSSGGSSSFSQE